MAKTPVTSGPSVKPSNPSPTDMASFTNRPDQFTQKVCEALGEKGRHVTSIHLYLDAGELATVSINRILDTEELAAIADAYETEGVKLAEAETTYFLEPKRKEA